MANMKTTALLAVALTWVGLPTLGADFPEQDLDGVIQWRAKGATDTVTRALVPLVEPVLGQQINLSNSHAGASGVIATEYVHSQPADGYTLLFGAENPQLYPLLNLLQVDYGDFYPVNVIARGTAIIVAGEDAPWNSLSELIAVIKANPGTIRMGTTGPAGLPTTTGAILRTAAELDVFPIPFDGDGPIIYSLLSGFVDFSVVGLPAAQRLVNEGRLKALAVFSDEPHPSLPEVPPITREYPELQKYLPFGPFYGVFVRQETPDEAKKVLVDAFHQAVASDQFSQFLEDFGASKMDLSGEEAEAFLNHWQSTAAWMLHEIGMAKTSPESLGIPRP